MSSAIRQIQGCLGQLLQKNTWPPNVGEHHIQAPHGAPLQTNAWQPNDGENHLQNPHCATAAEQNQPSWSVPYPVPEQQFNTVAKNYNPHHFP